MKKGNRKTVKKRYKKHVIIKNKNIINYALIIFALICLISVSFFSYNTYSLWFKTYSQKGTNTVTTGCFELSVSDIDENNNSTSINLNNAYPLSNNIGLATKPYKLKISNICTVPSEYTVILNSFNSTTLDEGFLRYQIKDSSTVTTDTALLKDANFYQLDDAIKGEIEKSNNLEISKSYNLISGTLTQDETITYELRVWLDYDATNEAMNKKFEGAITVLSTSPQ